ncbi:unnamed protein product [Arabidopsis lyrata]|uniref:U-box domain-containing protein n=1 Tax=Arabidopsis lyrata subsp. lyrata TaxID=81972 RepID=D7MQG4_ARALL|nr:U-box domain-containing protein 4 [Arabidopsis lyrata subsp. lyrata]EFH42543.1 hypothetical protein ARALYDRAFT_919073 [Arabidopsis lyrata subsp. lyrata]CAH8280138.1 unnamed protein product [Arabidopsis lyrata]|eukprot:XP_002866284.1 U-box domain-containing protein 4 [Arabidopsis lyrata subsp. lyrata]
MENHKSFFTYIDHKFSDSSLNFDSSAFSDCNSDRSCDFPTTSSESRQPKLFLSCAVDNSDDLIRCLITHLESSSSSIEEQKQAAMEIRLLSKNKPEERNKIAKAGAIKPLVSLISSSDLQLQEYGVTAVLNLSICDENKEMIISSGAIKPLVNALRLGTPTTKENAACALLRLSQLEDNKIAIGRSGAIPLLVNLLENGGFRAKKDASTALYSLCSTNENKIRAVESGIMKPLVELMADFESEMVDKSAFVMNLLMSVPESKPAVVEEGGVPVLVEIVEAGTQRQKEMSVSILLQLCEESVVYRTMVAREGAVPPLVALSQSSSASRGAKVKAEALIALLRQPRQQQQHFESTDNER